jgi:hypothetical protein
VHRASEAWDETAVTWGSHAEAHASEVASTLQIPARAEAQGERDHVLKADLTALVQGWLDGTWPNHGIMLIGGEDQAGTAKWFSAREALDVAERPRLLLEWQLTTQTPTATPVPSLTPMPAEHAVLVPLIIR